MIQRNNPANIRFSIFNLWQGQTGSEDGFVTFDSLENGTRAQIKLLREYINDGDDTIQKIVTRWSPPNENDTAGLIASYAYMSGIDPFEKIDFSDQLKVERVVTVMQRIESGETVSDITITNEYLKLANYSGGFNLPEINISAENPVKEVIIILAAIAILIVFATQSKQART